MKNIVFVCQVNVLTDFLICCNISKHLCPKGSSVQVSSVWFDVIYNDKCWPGNVQDVEDKNCISSSSTGMINKPVKVSDMHWN